MSLTCCKDEPASSNLDELIGDWSPTVHFFWGGQDLLPERLVRLTIKSRLLIELRKKSPSIAFILYIWPGGSM